MANLALYREYRPKNFDSVIGQEHIIKTLINQIKNDNLSHAYLFCGTRGTGKTSTAKIFAKAINCENNKNGSPCNECEVCKNLSNNSNLYILEIDAASNKRVDEIRDLREKIKYPPVNGKYKVYIVDEVHMLTESAFNALLKTLEEPPKHAIFILCTTEVHKLPKTILSRCMRFDFRLVSNYDLKNLLVKIFKEKNINFDEESLHLIASRGEGSVRDTLSVADLCASFCNNNITYEGCLDALGTSKQEDLINITKSLSENDGENLLLELNNVALSGKNFTILSKELINHFKTLLTIKTVKNSQKFLMLPNDIYEKLSIQANAFSNNKLLEIMTKLSSIETQLKYSINSRTLLEITLLSMLEIIDEKKTENLNFDNEKKNLKIKNNDHKLIKDKEIIFKEEKKETDNSKLIYSKVLKYLKENSYHSLLNCFLNFKEIKSDNFNFIVDFEEDKNQDFLENIDNINIINEILKEFNLTIKYNFNTIIDRNSVEFVLKNKFKNLEIKE